MLSTAWFPQRPSHQTQLQLIVCHFRTRSFHIRIFQLSHTKSSSLSVISNLLKQKVDTTTAKSFMLKGQCIKFLSMQNLMRYLICLRCLFQIKCGATFEDPLGVVILSYVLISILCEKGIYLLTYRLVPGECAI